MGDVEALADFLLRVVGACDPRQLQAAVAAAMKRPPRAPGLADGILESLPASPGVYLFYGGPHPATDALLYVGSGHDLRSRVTGHFSPSGGSGLARRVAHLEVIETGKSLGSKSITVWLADGASFPGQNNLRRALQHTMDSLKTIYRHLPGDWKMYIEYKPYEPNFYSTVIQDWGTSYLLATECGGQAYTLVDLGHHLPNTNIEQIVATLMMKGKLGGFHFNDSKYGDDDLTVGSIKPYQLFLIFNELVYGMNNNTAGNPPLAWMIDASHNVKDPLEDLIQSLEAIRLAYAQALLVDSNALAAAQNDNDVTRAQEILQDAFRTDLRPLLREARLQSGAALEPLAVYRSLEVRKKLVRERGKRTVATGL